MKRVNFAIHLKKSLPVIIFLLVAEILPIFAFGQVVVFGRPHRRRHHPRVVYVAPLPPPPVVAYQPYAPACPPPPVAYPQGYAPSPPVVFYPAQPVLPAPPPPPVYYYPRRRHHRW